MEINDTAKRRAGDFRGAALNADVDVVVLAGLEGSTKRTLQDGEDKDVGSARVGFLEHEELGFGFEIGSVGSDPESGPPDFEAEDAHETSVGEFSDGGDVAAEGIDDVEAEEAAGGGGGGFGGGGGGGGRGGGDVMRDVGEDDVAVDQEV